VIVGKRISITDAAQWLPPDTGDVIDDRYELISPLARGGMSTVWQARDRRLGRDVALKVLDGRQLNDPLHAARIRVEAQALAKLTHPNIAVVHDLGSLDSQGRMPYVVMELVSGKPLSKLVGRLPWSLAAGVVAQLADALAAGHAIGIVHRDVSAANVLLTETGAKLVDYGIAAMTGDNDTVDDGKIMGTLAYLPPERLTGRLVHPAIDIFALGVLLHLLLTGRAPWPHGTSNDLAAILDRQPPRALNADGISHRMSELCLRCLSGDPRKRPTARQVGSVLRDAGARWDPVVAAALLKRENWVAPTVRLAGPTPAYPPRVPQQTRPANVRRLATAGAVLGLMGLAAWQLSGLPPASTRAPQALAPAVAADSPHDIACHATYQTTRARGGQFTSKIFVTNLGTQPVSKGWQLTISLPGVQALAPTASSIWHATPDGLATAAKPEPMAPNQPEQLALAGRYTGAIPHPDGIWLNGTECLAAVIEPVTPTTTKVNAPTIARTTPLGNPTKQKGKGPRHKPTSPPPPRKNAVGPVV